MFLLDYYDIEAPTLSNYNYGSFTSQGPVTALGASLKAWFTADDHGTARMTDDGSGLISSWKSQDGSAVTVTATTTARPTWTSNAISSPSGNSFAGMTFDGSANCLVSTTLTNIPTGATGGEIWTLARQDTPGSDATTRRIISYGGNTSNLRTLTRVQLNNVSRALLADGTTTMTDTITSCRGITVFGGAWLGTTESGRINGRATIPDSATITTVNTGTSRLRIGAGSNTAAANFWLGAIRHLMITTTLTALQRLQLEAWLAWDVGWQRYILPATHPFRVRRP